MSKKLAILWDVDGTLANSEPVHDSAVIAGLMTFGIEVTRCENLLGVSRYGVYAKFSELYEGMPDFDSYCDEVDRQFLAIVNKIKPFQSTTKACMRYHAEKRQQIAVSNSNFFQVDCTLKAIDMDRFLAGIISADEKCKPKPSFELYQRALDYFGITAAEAIAVEDSKIGCTAARAAGLFVVGVPEDDTDIGAHVNFRQFPNLTPEEIIALYG